MAKPLDLIRSPQSLLYPPFRDAVAENLRFEIRAQATDGAWNPNWNWDGAYPEAWEEARRKWRGILTLERLRILRSFGLLPDSIDSTESTDSTSSTSSTDSSSSTDAG